MNGLCIQWARVAASWDHTYNKTFAELGWVNFVTAPSINISDVTHESYSHDVLQLSACIKHVSGTDVEFHSFSDTVALIAIGYC